MLNILMTDKLLPSSKRKKFFHILWDLKDIFRHTCDRLEHTRDTFHPAAVAEDVEHKYLQTIINPWEPDFIIWA